MGLSNEEDDAAREIYDQEIEFIKKNFRGWISSMLSDFDAQGIPIDITYVAVALNDLATELIDDLHADGDTILEWLDIPPTLE